MGGLGNLPGQNFYVPDAAENAFDPRLFRQYMEERGYTAAEAPNGYNSMLRGVFDAQGNPVVPVEQFNYDGDQAFWNAGLAAMALTGANIGLATGGLGGGAVTGGAASTPSLGGVAGGGLAGGGFMDPTSYAGLVQGFTSSGGLPSVGSVGAAGFSVPSLGGSLAPSAGAGAGGVNWLDAGLGALDIAGGLYGMREARKASEAMDPFRDYRAGYAQKLAELEANPGSVMRLPGFQAGVRTIESNQGATGFYGSGNMLAALSEYGGNFYQQEADRLARLAGAYSTPGAGALGSAQLTGQSLASIGYGVGQLSRYFGGG
jgi:hypothetical protein